MKLRKNFTLIELLAVIAIIGILAAALVGGVGAAIDRANAAACQANLTTLGKSMVQYKMDYRYFPCGVKDTDSSSTIERRRKEIGRSTLRTMQVYSEYDAEDMDPVRFYCPVSDKMQPRRKEDRLRKENVGYHYVNGDVSSRIIKDNVALMRDLNEGHEDAEYGMILLGNGSVKKVSKLGKESKSQPGNYRTNWYRNDDILLNAKDFDGYSRKVNPRRPDDID